jgi:rubrerythrin
MAELNTASAVISFAHEIEEDGVSVYENLAQRFPEHSDLFLSFAAENHKNIKNVERTYYSVVTDALEGCFSFKLDSSKYDFEKATRLKSTFKDEIQHALDIEEKTVAFYTAAADQSKSLIADVSRAFTLVARKRGERLETLREFITNKERVKSIIG